MHSRHRSRGRSALVVAMLIIAGALLSRFDVSAQDAAADAMAPDAAVQDAAVSDAAVEVVEVPSSNPAGSGEPQEVIVGAYIRNVENIDLASNSYSVSAILWMKWHKGGIDPTETMRLTNVIDESSLTMVAEYPQPIEVDGLMYQRFRVEGTFWHKFWLGTFPLDWQRVTMELEDTRHVSDELVFVPDTQDSGVHPNCVLPGWVIVEQTNEAFIADAGTDYGMGSLSPGTTFPGYRFGLRIERSINFYAFKILPPILLTLACCFLVFLLKPMYVDARVGTPIAALLTAVFLQLTFTGNLPNVGIMLLIDHVFNLTYTVIFVVALVCMVTTRNMDTIATLTAEIADAEGEEREQLRTRVEHLDHITRRLDRRMLLILPIAYLGGVAIITYVVRGSYLFEMLGR